MPPVTLNDDVFTEILLRLPPKSVFRSRAVCKLWRSITTCASFVAAYSRRRPLELLVYPDAYKPSPGSKNAVAAVSLDGTATGCRRLLRQDAFLTLFGSCDGLLLFSQAAQDSFLICNPATRQWARLPALKPHPCSCVMPAGFYFHRPSGEYRVLCDGSERRSPTDPQINRGTHHMCHYVLSTSGAGPRRLGPFDETPDGDGRAHVYSDCGVVVSGTLYWAKHSQLAETSMNMLAFDTVTEAFRRVPLPSVTCSLYKDLSLFDMHGTLAASVRPARLLELDRLEDEYHRLFEPKDRDRSLHFGGPSGRNSRPLNEAVATLEGDMLAVFASGWVVLYDMKEKKMVSKVDQSYNCSCALWCVYRESLVPAVPKGQPSPAGEPMRSHDHLKLLHYC
ncbi:F-box only protein 8-like [Aegilops tauschii subsp. strangulata]|uniref:F-box only protein 8-like n=1 Tax=Aegilops tauschii subsp. strangulata TaxID=200361 RepID=UPI00098B161E